MKIDDKTRKKLKEVLRGTNYRKVVSERAECHFNTVANILEEEPKVRTAKVERVEIELLAFAQEVLESKAPSEERKKKARAFAKQLS